MPRHLSTTKKKLPEDDARHHPASKLGLTALNPVPGTELFERAICSRQLHIQGDSSFSAKVTTL